MQRKPIVASEFGVEAGGLLGSFRTNLTGVDADRLGNLPQLRTLLDAGYSGFVSYEPFAEEIAAATDIEARLAASMAHLQAGVAAPLANAA